MWNIRKVVSKGDYNYAVVPEHPRAARYGYVLEHRVIMENFLGRLLERHEVVHHKDENKKNNSISNLEVMHSSDHSRLHVKPAIPNSSICKNCQKPFTRRKGLTSVFCSRSCNGKYQRAHNWTGKSLTRK